MASHTEGAKKGKFCSKRMEECPCGNKYKAIMSGTESWGKYKQKHKRLVAVERSPEAHHVLPVASVTEHVTSNQKIRDEVVENTEWCVNVEANMIALPLFEMTLTHYLSHSVVGVALFYGYGLGLWGSFGPTLATALILALFGLQALASTVWLRRFRQGPVEWVWRRFTYGNLAYFGARGSGHRDPGSSQPPGLAADAHISRLQATPGKTPTDPASHASRKG